MKLTTHMVEVEYIDSYTDGDKDQFDLDLFHVTDLETKEVYSISYEKAIHQIVCSSLEYQKDGKSTVTGRDFSVAMQDFSRMEYLVKTICQFLMGLY